MMTRVVDGSDISQTAELSGVTCTPLESYWRFTITIWKMVHPAKPKYSLEVEGLT